MSAFVSIVIPCYNGAAYLAQAIESCLRQTHAEIEVIVVNDASPDACEQIASSYVERDNRVRLINLKSNRGVSGAFNAGFAVAAGEFMTRLAQDDMFREDAIEILVNCLRRSPDAGLVYCDMQIIDEAGAVYSYKKNADANPERMAGNQVGLCFMWTKNVWREIGEFDRRYDMAEDYDFWRRVADRFKLVYCPEAPFFNRKHPAMGSRTYAVRQQLGVDLIRARYVSGFWARRAVLSRAYFDAAYDSGGRGAAGQAIRFSLRAILMNPLWSKPYRCVLRLCVGFALRKSQTVGPKINQTSA